LPEKQANILISKYKDIINNNSGKVVKIEQWGLKKLSYVLKNNKKGFYFHIKFEGMGKTIEELEKAENIDQMLIRFLTVRVKKHDLSKIYFEKKDI
jgi:small subunit ribosomal protein S6